MVYCSNCGAELSSASRFCSRCGFKVEKESEAALEDIIEAEPLNDSEASDADSSKVTPALDRTCVECEKDAEQKCYFCWANICNTHTKRLQIFINKAPFGNQVVSCRKCADEKHGQQPTRSEAEGASLFFGVKPYHEWKLVK